MKFDVRRAAFQPILRKAVQITKGKTMMPILSNVLISCDQKTLTMKATDLEISMIALMPIEQEGRTEFLVNGPALADIVQNLDPSEYITFDVGNQIVRITQRKTAFSLSFGEVEEFPQVESIEGKTFELKGSDLTNLLDKVTFAIATDETRYSLTGVCLMSDEGNITAIGADGYRAALMQVPFSGKIDYPVIIPKGTVMMLPNLVSEQDTVEITVQSSKIMFKFPAITLISRVIDGTFPDVKAIIPNHSNSSTFPRQAMINAVQRCRAIGKDAPVKLTFGNTSILVESEGTMGAASDEIDAENDIYTEFSLNGRFLSDILTHLTGESCTMRLPESYGAVMVKEDDYINICMPIRS